MLFYVSVRLSFPNMWPNYHGKDWGSQMGICGFPNLTLIFLFSMAIDFFLHKIVMAIEEWRVIVEYSKVRDLNHHNIHP